MTEQRDSPRDSPPDSPPDSPADSPRDSPADVLLDALLDRAVILSFVCVILLGIGCTARLAYQYAGPWAAVFAVLFMGGTLVLSVVYGLTKGSSR